MQAVEILMSVFRLSLCLCCTVSSYSWVSQLLKECRYIYNKCNNVYLMHFQRTFPQHFFTTFCVEFFFIFRENDYRKCCLISVCWPPRSHLHAQEVPARSHVPSSRADQACSPLHLIPNRLSGCTVGGEDDQVHLHSLPRHGNIFTRYIWLWNIQLGMNQ